MMIKNFLGNNHLEHLHPVLNIYNIIKFLL